MNKGELVASQPETPTEEFIRQIHSIVRRIDAGGGAGAAHILGCWTERFASGKYRIERVYTSEELDELFGAFIKGGGPPELEAERREWVEAGNRIDDYSPSE